MSFIGYSRSGRISTYELDTPDRIDSCRCRDSGLVSLASAMMTLKTASRRAGVDEKIAQARREVDQQIAQERGAVDRELAAIKAQYDKELAEQKARLDNRAVYAAERVVHELLMHPQWKQRTFEAIQRRLDGFEGMELKRILVQAGAVRFTHIGKEYWGLTERNRDALEGSPDPDSDSV